MKTKTMVRGVGSGLAGAARRAFSLLELMLVLAIIGILMGVAAYNLLGQSDAAKLTATKASLKILKNGIDQYYITNSVYPPNLQALVTAKLIQPPVPKDGWKNDFYYDPTTPESAEAPYRLLSPGKDKQNGTADDVNVWTMDVQPGTPVQ